jgi:hypothetical protein
LNGTLWYLGYPNRALKRMQTRQSGFPEIGRPPGSNSWATRWLTSKHACLEAKRSRWKSYWNKLAYLGRDYVAVAFSQYYQNCIDEEQLGAYLDTKPKNIATLEEYFLKGNTA